MKIRVTMKDPDALHYSLEDAGYTDESPDYDNVLEVAAKWMTYGEYITIEIDTEAGTAIVVPAK